MGKQGKATIEVFGDIWCPFTHVGLRAVDEIRRVSARSDVTIRVRPWPLELVNDHPRDPEVTLIHVNELRDQVSPTMFRGFRLNRFPPSTLEALALAEQANGRDIRLGEQLSVALRDALFEEGRDISDPEVLADLAERTGRPRQHDRGVRLVAITPGAGPARGVTRRPGRDAGATLNGLSRASCRSRGARAARPRS